MSIRSLILVLGVLCSFSASAKTPCSDEGIKYCGHVPSGGGRRLRCLATSGERITPECRAYLNNSVDITTSSQANTPDLPHSYAPPGSYFESGPRPSHSGETYQPNQPYVPPNEPASEVRYPLSGWQYPKPVGHRRTPDYLNPDTKVIDGSQEEREEGSVRAIPLPSHVTDYSSDSIENRDTKSIIQEENVERYLRQRQY